MRKEIRPDLDVTATFLTELNRSVKTILALLYENHDFRVGQATIINGDTRQADKLLAQKLGAI